MRLSSPDTPGYPPAVERALRAICCSVLRPCRIGRLRFRKTTLSGRPFLQNRCSHPGRLILSLRSEEHTSELQSLMRNSYAVFCLKKKTSNNNNTSPSTQIYNKHS